MGKSKLVENLTLFNRKERFFLLGYALGRPTFALDPTFAAAVSTKLGIPPIPDDAFVAMDYHLDWLHAALALARQPEIVGVPQSRDPERRQVTGTQEDIDLLIAYEAEDTCHLVLVEAKGVTSYSNSQFVRKVRRLAAIFHGHEDWPFRLQPHLLLISPSESKGLKMDEVVRWMLPGENQTVAWLPLTLPDRFLRVELFPRDGSAAEKKGQWAIRRVTRRVTLQTVTVPLEANQDADPHTMG